MIAATPIRERLLEIEANARLLEDLRGTPVEAFVRNPRAYKLAERCFHVAIECMIDIADHLIAERGWPRPESARDALLTLGAQGVLPVSFAEQIAPMAGLRNLLVHGYMAIDRRQLHTHLSRVKDFSEFIQNIDAYLTASA
jgi:uncharacterized protein YutE (UPF0331/DUF86 family)